MDDDPQVASSGEVKRPQRKRLAHDVPPWVPEGSRYFITINAVPRGTDSLCRDSRGVALMESVGVYERLGIWWMHLFVVMPDHVHLIATFGRDVKLQQAISAWKGYQAKRLGLVWQSGFFEHRLRHDDAFIEKMHYVRMNPVRKGLVEHAGAWPYLLER